MLELKLNMAEFVTTIVAEDISNPGSRYFLIAPGDHHLDKDDEVVAAGSYREFKVVFSASYVAINSELYNALKEALGNPMQIIKHKMVRDVKWGDENESIAVSPPDNSTGRSWSEV